MVDVIALPAVSSTVPIVKLDTVRLEPFKAKLELAKIVTVEAVIWPPAVKEPPEPFICSV